MVGRYDLVCPLFALYQTNISESIEFCRILAFIRVLKFIFVVVILEVSGILGLFRSLG